MGTTVHVKDYVGEVLQRECVDESDLLRLVDHRGLPLLGNVDLYDDTVFNRLQSSELLRELDRLASLRPREPLVQEIRVMVEIVQRRPHRYLVFNGD